MDKNMKSRNQIVTECRRKLYDQIQINLPKGSRETYRTYAEALGVSLNSFVVMAMNDFIKNHTQAHTNVYPTDKE